MSQQIVSSDSKSSTQVSLAFLDAGMPQHAVAGLQKLHGIDAKWPDIDRLLVRTSSCAVLRIQDSGFGEMACLDCSR